MVHSLNEEQLVLFDDILHKKRIYPNETLSIFFIKGVGTRKTFTLMVIIHGLFQYYLNGTRIYIDQNKQFKKWHTHEKLHIILVDQHYTKDYQFH
jgi:hypothetical protein